MSRIKKIKLIPCGSCENDLGIVFRGHPKEKRYFPAMVGIIIHEDFGPILYDTGYSKLIFKNGLISKLYNGLNKATVNDSDVISEKINVEEVKTIILSHAHPDHIGALPLFRNIKLISTKEVFDTMENPRLFDLVFKNMRPDDSVTKVTPNIIEDDLLSGYFSEVYDVLGDRSVIGVRLDGHAKGQLGLFFPDFDLLLAADSCWGTDLLDLVDSMKPIPRKVQNDFVSYSKTVNTLKRLKSEHPEIEIVFSHQTDLFEGKIYE